MNNNFQLLNTTDLTNEIEKILIESEKYIIILSPYLKIHQRLIYYIKNISIKTIVIYRECENDSIKYLKENKNIQILQG